MDVVVLGGRERNDPSDQKKVVEVLEGLRKKYGTTMVVFSVSCDQGIGSFVKSHCVKTMDENNRHAFKFIEAAMHVFAELPRAHMNRVYGARNSSLLKLGDEFHVFVYPDQKGTLQEFIAEAVATERPVYLYELGRPDCKLLNLIDEHGRFDRVEL